MQREPVITTATVTAAVTALVAVLVSFGVPLSEDQQVAILSVVAVVAPLVLAALARPKVTANAVVVARKGRDGETVAGQATTIETGRPVAVDMVPTDETETGQPVPGGHVRITPPGNGRRRH